MKIQRRHALINNGRCRVETMVAIIKDRTGPRGERRAGRLRGPPLEAALRGPSPRKRASFLFSFWWKSQNVSTLPSGPPLLSKIFSKTFQSVNELKSFFEFGRWVFEPSLPRAHVGGKIRMCQPCLPISPPFSKKMGKEERAAFVECGWD